MNIRKTVISKRANDFVGTLFTPDIQEKDRPGVILIPGSEGGVPESLAEWISTRGFSVLALGYFGAEGLSPTLENIHLEYFQRAMEWFKSQMKKVVLVGYSRGGELALILGSVFPDLMDGIVTFVPCSCVCGGFPYTNKPAWLLNNKPASPFLHGIANSNLDLTELEDLQISTEQGTIPTHANTPEDPYEIAQLFLARHATGQTLHEAEIPVEKITCPLLIFSGGKDKIWPSSLYGQRIMDRLGDKNSQIKRKHILFPDAGHGIISPYEGPIYHPIGKFWCSLGGIPEENQKANKTAWEQTFIFLNN